MSILMTSATGKLRFQTANPSGTLYDPEDFVVTVRSPEDPVAGGTEYVYAEGDPESPIERVSMGEFLLRVADLFPPGRWHWRAIGVDEGDAGRVDVSEGSFMVRHSRVVSNSAL